MKDYIEYLNLPTTWLAIIAGVFLALNLVGLILDVKGKFAPEFMNIRKRIRRKKQERETAAEMVKMLPEFQKSLAEVKQTLDEVLSHYNKDNITMRNKWMNGVDDHVSESEKWKKEFCEKLDQNTEITLEIRIENMRSEIISFAQYVINGKNIVTHDQFSRIFRIYDQYEAILEKYEKTNGETDSAMEIIRKSYENHMKKNNFAENLCGYPGFIQADEEP